MQDDWGEVNEWLAAVKAFIIDTRGLEQVGGLQWVLLAILVLLAAAMGQFGKRRLLAVLPRPTDKGRSDFPRECRLRRRAGPLPALAAAAGHRQRFAAGDAAWHRTAAQCAAARPGVSPSTC